MQSANHVINLDLFLSEYSVFADLSSYIIKINTTNTTSRTDSVDVSAWYYRGDDNNAVTNVRSTDAQ